MPRDDRERLEDALEAVQRAVEFGAGFTAAALEDDVKTLAAIKYELVILGEAVTGMSQATLENAPEMPWKQMRGLRNVVTHEYFRVDVNVVHQLATVDLPALLPLFVQLLKSARI